MKERINNFLIMIVKCAHTKYSHSSYQHTEDWMIDEIVSRHKDGILDNGVPNPSLDVVCGLVSKASKAITPAVQRRSFRDTGLTLAVDGSEDDELCPVVKDLFRKHNQDPKLYDGDLSHFMSPHEPAKSAIPKVFQILCADAAKLPTEEFCMEPVLAKKKKNKDQRYEIKINSIL